MIKDLLHRWYPRVQKGKAVICADMATFQESESSVSFDCRVSFQFAPIHVDDTSFVNNGDGRDIDALFVSPLSNLNEGKLSLFYRGDEFPMCEFAGSEFKYSDDVREDDLLRSLARKFVDWFISSRTAVESQD